MPQTKNYLSYFTTMTLGVERRISQLLNYIRPLSPTAVGEMQERMLMNITRQLRESIDHCQLTWLKKRNEVHPLSTEKVRKLVDSTVNTGEAALRKAQRFIAQCCGIASNRKPPTHQMTDPTVSTIP